MIKSTNLNFFINATKFPSQKTKAIEITTKHIRKIVTNITIFLILIFVAMKIVIPVLSISYIDIIVSCVLLGTYINMILGIWHGVIFTWYYLKNQKDGQLSEINLKISILIWVTLSLISYFVISFKAFGSINVLYLLLCFVFTYLLITLASYHYLKNQ